MSITEEAYTHLESIGALMTSKSIAIYMLMSAWQNASPEQQGFAREAVTAAKAERKKLTKATNLTTDVNAVLDRLAAEELCTKAVAIDLIIELWLNHLNREQLASAKRAAAAFKSGGGEDTIETT